MDTHVRNSGCAVIQVIGPCGTVLSTARVDNLVVDTGLNWIAARLADSPALMSHMAMGTGTTAVLATDTTLVSEKARVGLSSSAATDATTVFIATFLPGTFVGQVTELGIFNAVSGGTMLNRVSIPAQTKGSSDTVKVEWYVTQAA